MGDGLDRAAVAAVDRSDLLADILAIPDHIVDAMWRAESAFLQPSSARSLTICGMGGSAIGADLAAAVIGTSASGPIITNRGYNLSSWVGQDDVVVLSSYSGSTEETLSCFEQAKASGARLYVVSSGGPLSEAAHTDGIPVIGLPGIFQPRAAVAYGIVSVAEIAIVNGFAPSSLRADFTAAAERLRALGEQWPPGAPANLPEQLARAAFGRLPVVYGADLTAPIAYRWKGQINENAKYPAFSGELPEADHNEVCGWEGAAELVEPVVWFLADADQHPRIADRIRFTAEIASEHRAQVQTIELPGGPRAERLFALVLLGDLMSLYLAALRGVDPTPVTAIEDLKARLARPSGAA
jgi:glucose/mannose-6-phosphate isomerase